MIPNEPFRERFLALHARGELNASDLARRLGWFQNNGRPDQSRVMRSLGLRKHQNTVASFTRQRIKDSHAEAFCEALGVDPVDVGL